jgi:hypothetical protein
VSFIFRHGPSETRECCDDLALVIRRPLREKILIDQDLLAYVPLNCELQSIWAWVSISLPPSNDFQTDAIVSWGHG